MANTEQLQSFDNLLLEVRCNEQKVKDGYQEIFVRLPGYVSVILRKELGTIEQNVFEDLLSTTVASVWEKIATWDPQKGTFATWVGGVVHHKRVDYIRARKKEQDHIQDRDFDDVIEIQKPSETELLGVLPEIFSKELEIVLLKTLMQFDDLEKTIFLVRINSDFTFQQLAEIVQSSGHNLTAKAVEHRFYRTRDRLQELLEQALS